MSSKPQPRSDTSPDALSDRLRALADEPNSVFIDKYRGAWTRDVISAIREAASALAAAAEREQALVRKLESEYRSHEQTISERDGFHDAADKLAYAIATIEAIGEHSNLNDPWENALEELESIKQRAEAWGLLNQARELDQKTVARAKSELAARTQEREACVALIATWRSRRVWAAGLDVHDRCADELEAVLAASKTQ